MTVLIMQGVETWQEETKVPIAIVVEEQTEMAAHLVDNIDEYGTSPYPVHVLG